MARWLEVAGRPREALISIGATRYTDYGESHFLERGDEAIVVVYDSRRHSPAAIRAWIDAGAREAKVGVSLLCQRVVQASSSGARG